MQGDGAIPALTFRVHLRPPVRLATAPTPPAAATPAAAAASMFRNLLFFRRPFRPDLGRGGGCGGLFRRLGGFGAVASATMPAVAARLRRGRARRPGGAGAALGRCSLVVTRVIGGARPNSREKKRLVVPQSPAS